MIGGLNMDYFSINPYYFDDDWIELELLREEVEREIEKEQKNKSTKDT